jgi:hypothetical protein
MVAVVIPIYRNQPPPMEIFSLQRCLDVLRGYSLVFVGPAGLDTSWYRKFCEKKQDLFFEEFNASYFRSIGDYSKLLTSSKFYDRFLLYKFILIHQLDAYVFNDSLQHWCTLDYDYIGAPWINAPWHNEACNGIKVTIFQKQSFVKRQFTKLSWMLRGMGTSKRLLVGNGGFSLRKVRTFRDLAHDSQDSGVTYNEDLYWSMYIPLTSPHFKIADMETALGFCFDSNPSLCLSLNRGQLPFAAHAWYRDEDVYKGNFDFWKTYIKTR